LSLFELVFILCRVIPSNAEAHYLAFFYQARKTENGVRLSHELWLYRWMEAAQIDANFSVTQSSSSCTHHVYSLLLSPASIITFSPLPHFLFFSKAFPTVKSWSREPRAKLGKKLISSGRHEGSDKAGGLAFFPCFLPLAQPA